MFEKIKRKLKNIQIKLNNENENNLEKYTTLNSSPSIATQIAIEEGAPVTTENENLATLLYSIKNLKLIIKHYIKKIILFAKTGIKIAFIIFLMFKVFNWMFLKINKIINWNDIIKIEKDSNDNSEFTKEKIEALNNEIFEYYKNSTIPDIENHLIIVTGHGISKNTNEFPINKNSWYLKSFQDQEEVNAFLSQILTGIFIAKHNPNSVLIFSGGQTQIEAGPQSESQSYWSIANSINWNNNTEIRNRATTEEFSKDSFENLLFSICRYHEFTGKYPNYISVISFPYKHYRFYNLHRKALKYPSSNFQFVSVNANTIRMPNAKFIFKKPSTEMPNNLPDFEIEHSINSFIKDPYGCQGKLLEKKIQRNPYKRVHPFTQSCPEIQKLFNYCGSDIIPDEINWNMEEKEKENK